MPLHKQPCWKMALRCAVKLLVICLLFCLKCFTHVHCENTNAQELDENYFPTGKHVSVWKPVFSYYLAFYISDIESNIHQIQKINSSKLKCFFCHLVCGRDSFSESFVQKIIHVLNSGGRRIRISAIFKSVFLIVTIFCCNNRLSLAMLNQKLLL